MTWGELEPATAIRAGDRALVGRRLGTGPRMVLLHGGPGLDHHLVLPLALALAAEFEVLAPDLPGHGGSHGRGASLPDLSRVVEDAGRWIEALDPPPIVLAGHSLGAFVALEVLRKHRLAPDAAVLISPPAAGAGAGPSVRTTGGRSSARAVSRRRERALRDAVLEFCTADTGVPPSPEMIASVGSARLRPPEEYVALRGQLGRALAAPAVRLRVRTRVLVLTGEHDRVGPPEPAAALARAIGAARFEVVPGAGHVPFASDAGPVAAAIAAFVSDAPSGLRTAP